MESVFLLAFDLRKERLVGRGELGYLLRAAALAELLIGGHLADEEGKARTVTPPSDPSPLAAAVWEQIAGSPSRTWRRWIGKDGSLAFRMVRDELAAARLIRVERRRILLFPVERITPRRLYLSRRLAEQVGTAVRGRHAVSRLAREVRLLAALAGAARLTVVLPAREWRAHGKRIEELSAPVQPLTTALRQALESQRAAQSGGG
ncbi:MAG TPA: GPP34 family phosphoprotein [Nonomuraea sp.]|nr:GPP34 family phosphoprotein [Nonomuraea sp.]